MNCNCKAWFAGSTRSFSRLGIVLALALGTLTCTARELTVAVSKSTQSLLFYVAESQKYFEREGIEIKTRECLGGFRCIKLMLEGEVPLATAAEIAVMLNSFERSDYAIITAIAQGVNNIKLIARKSAGIETPAQLSGKRVGITRGTNAHYFLHAFLLFHGLDPQKTVAVHFLPEQMAQAMRDGKIDAATIWEPFARDVLRLLSADGIALPTARIYRTSFVLLGKPETISSREDDMRKLLRALLRAQDFIAQKPEGAKAILAKHLQFTPDQVELIWNDQTYRLALDQSLLYTLEGEARWALRTGLIAPDSKIPDYRDFVEDALLRKVAPDSVTFRR